MQSFYSNGKLLLTGEYFVLNGAESLAVPTKYGQQLHIRTIDEPLLKWNSYNVNKQVWFAAEFETKNWTVKKSSDGKIAETLQKILKTARKYNPGFLKSNGAVAETFLNFPRNWGLGTSSTLINNIARWAKVDSYRLLFESFGGSGYDIACAQNNQPVLYRLVNSIPSATPVHFNPVFKENLYFVHLNRKQSSKEAIAGFRKKNTADSGLIKTISEISKKVIKAQHLSEFEELIKQHEALTGSTLGQKPVQERLFNDYFGQTKSLGAWGGDFILATGNAETPRYFIQKGYSTVIPYTKMVRQD